MSCKSRADKQEARAGYVFAQETEGPRTARDLCELCGTWRRGEEEKRRRGREAVWKARYGKERKRRRAGDKLIFAHTPGIVPAPSRGVAGESGGP